MIDRDMFGSRRGEYPLPHGSTPSRCASCGKWIVWTVTPSGARMPLSVETTEHRDGGSFALSHFADCPEAADWRRKR